MNNIEAIEIYEKAMQFINNLPDGGDWERVEELNAVIEEFREREFESSPTASNSSL